MKIGIVGSLGIVGSATTFGLRKIGHEVIEYDLRKEGSKIEDLLDTRVIFVCVPTPQNEDGSCDISIVENIVKELNRLEYAGTIAIKSTVPPGTTDRLNNLYAPRSKYDDRVSPNVIFVPEILRERHNISDFVENMSILVVGCNYNYAYQQIVDIHGKLPKSTVCMSPIEAELFKYMHNAINALRVVFCNEVYDIATKLGANYTTVKEAVLLSTNLPDQYMDCNENCRGYSSICFNKDIPALIKIGEKLGTNPKLIRTIVEANDLLKKTPFSGTRE